MQQQFRREPWRALEELGPQAESIPCRPVFAMSDPRFDFFVAKCALCGVEPSKRWVFVSIQEERLYAYEGEKIAREFVCSTSANPPSCAYGSNGTPLGLHRVAEKIGEGAPEGTIFVKRENTGKIFEKPEPDTPNLITSRIMWLEGLEAGKNKGEHRDSYARKIYIHGTNHEAKVGTPFSGGCINLKNNDVIELFGWVGENELVLID